MVDLLKNWILNIVVVAILIVLLEMLMPTGKTKKLLNLVSGFVLIIVIISPVVKIIGNGMALEDIQVISSDFINREEIKNSSKILEEKQIKMTVDVYREKLINQVEDTVSKICKDVDVSADVIINEDYESESFGEVIRVYVNNGNKRDNGGIQPVKPIQPIKTADIIEIDENGSNSDNGEEDESDGLITGDARINNEIKEKISILFNIDKDNVIINTL